MENKHLESFPERNKAETFCVFEWKSIEDRQLGVMPVTEHNCVCSYEIVDVVYSSGSKPFWLVTD